MLHSWAGSEINSLTANPNCLESITSGLNSWLFMECDSEGFGCGCGSSPSSSVLGLPNSSVPHHHHPPPDAVDTAAPSGKYFGTTVAEAQNQHIKLPF